MTLGKDEAVAIPLNRPWDPAERETELVYGYIVGLSGIPLTVLYLSDGGISR